jgi:signal peptidase I
VPSDATDHPNAPDAPPEDASAGATTVVAHAAVDGGDPVGTLDESRGKGSGYRWVIEWAVILMAVPTLDVGDRIMVNKLSYDLHSVHRGDIIVFKRPPLEEQDFPDLVKRVVGLPGETISTRNGHVYINNKLLAEPWLPAGPQSYTGALPDDQHPQFNMPGPVHIPAGEYFVMGDNRTDSEDSRFFGPIPESLIVGRAVAVVWPLSRAKGV